MTTACIFSFLGFWCWYHTSKRTDRSQRDALATWLHNDPVKSKGIGLLSLLVSVVTFVFYLGVGAGVFAFFVALMTFGSLIVVLTPLRVLNYKTFGLVVFIAFLIEIFPF